MSKWTYGGPWPIGGQAPGCTCDQEDADAWCPACERDWQQCLDEMNEENGGARGEVPDLTDLPF